MSPLTSAEAAGRPPVLVTGGAGYLGVPLLEALLDAGRPVRCFDRLAFGDEPLSHLRGRSGFELVTGDLRRLDRFPDLLAGVGAVVHLAALSDAASCDLDPDATSAVNRDATARLIEAALAAGVRRFVYASTCAVFGEGDGDAVFTESSPVRPATAYARSKAEGERLVLAAASRGLSAVVLRFATLFGAAPRMRFDLVLNTMTLDALAAGVIRVDCATHWRPLLHVRDAARGALAALDADDTCVGGQVFNLGATDQNFRIAEIAQSVREVLPEVAIGLSADASASGGYRVSFERARQRLGLESSRSIGDGVREIAAAWTAGAFPDPERSLYRNARRFAELGRAPAAESGEPVRSAPLPFALPSLGAEEEAEVIDTLRSGWLTAGPKTRRFEERFAERVGAAHAVATNSCTAALQVALAALGIGPDDEVITSPITFPATANVILHQGARPVFVDVDPRTLNLDVERLEAARSPRTRAVLPVHFAGNPCRMDDIRAFAAAYGLAVVEDAAHAAGARLGGRPVGALGEATCFSFYPIKNMTAAEGGMLTTDDARLAARARLLATHGVTRDAWSRHGPAGELHWETVAAGFKANMTDLQAAVGLAQLGKLDGFLARRRELAARYAEAFAELPELRLLGPTPGGESAHHLLVVLLELGRLRIDRDGFALALRAEGIGVGIHFRSLHRHRFYRDLMGDLDDRLPVATEVSERLLSLPLYPAMSDQDCDDAIRAVRKLAAYYRNPRA